MKKIIFAGTPEIAAGILEALIKANYNIIACLTQPDRPQGRGLKLTPSAVKVCALKHKISVLQPISLKNPEVQKQLQDLNPDLMIVMAYGLILPPAVLNIPKLGCINIHASILPRWRGAAPIQHAILAGDTTSGITIMQVDAGLDTGDILATYSCPVNNLDNAGNLHDRLAVLAQSSCIDALSKLFTGQLDAIKQDNNLATYAHKINKPDAKINWHASAVEINRAIRAYNPWPIAFTTFKQEIVRVWRAELVDSAILKSNATPGTILTVDKMGLDVATGNGILRLLDLQFPGKKTLPVAAICNSNLSLVPGALFV